ncbi:MAG: hypothetical protein KDA67_05685 [Rhodobacteraceae bacterium]|nr:hypothetical protein [Paracoccaceae bacterium]
MQKDRQFLLLRLAAGLSLLLALVNHLLPPKPFAMTQLLFDYQFGPVRRGMVGEILNLFTGDEVSRGEVYLAAAVITLAGAFGFYLLLKRLMPLELVGGWLLLILSLNSFAFASFVGNTGYLDGLLLALVALALASDGARVFGLMLRLVIAGLGVMVHENMLPYFTILIGFDLWLTGQRAGWSGARAFLAALAPAFVALAVLVVLTGAAAVQSGDAAAFAGYLEGKAAFWLDPTSTDVAGRSIGSNFALMAELRGTTKYRAWLLFDGLPLALMSLWLYWLAMRLMPKDEPWFTRLLLAGVLLAPISLNVIAFDVVRFGVASVLSGFLAIGLLIRHRPWARERLQAVLTWPHFLVVLVLNVNIFTIQINIGAFHVSQFPWILVTQLRWLMP